MDPVGGKLEPLKKEIKIKERNQGSSIHDDIKEVTTFGTSERQNFITNEFVPGPNAYQQVELQVKKKKGRKKNRDNCTFGVKSQKFLIPNTNPGPGAYPAEASGPGSPHFSIGRSQRINQELPVYADKLYDSPDLNTSPKIG